jgi:hypothetical protein
MQSGYPKVYPLGILKHPYILAHNMTHDKNIYNQDPDNKHLTHLVLQEGHLWDKKELTLPISAIARMDENYIYLKLDKKTVKSLSKADN